MKKHKQTEGLVKIWLYDTRDSVRAVDRELADTLPQRLEIAMKRIIKQIKR